MTTSTTSTEIIVTDGTSGTRITPVDVALSAQAEVVGDRTLRVTDRNLVIDGWYDDTGWHYEFTDGNYLRKGASCNWISGLEYHGIKVRGFTCSINNIGHTNPFNKADGGAIIWKDVRIETRSSGRSDFTIDDDIATDYDIDGLVIATDLGNEENHKIDFDTGTIKNVVMPRCNLAVGGTGTLENVRFSGLQESNQENKIQPSENNTSLVKLAPYISADGKKLAVRLDAIPGSTGKQVYLDDLIVPDYWDNTTDISVFGGAGKVTVRRTVKMLVKEGDNNIRDARVIVTYGSTNTSDSNELTGTNGIYNELLEVYEATLDETEVYRLPTTFIDKQSKRIRIRRANLNDLEANYDLSAKGIDVTQFMSVDAAFTGTIAEAAAITGIAINSGSDTITVSSAKTLQEVYNYVKSWLAGSGIYRDSFISKVGNTLDLGSWNLVVNSSITLSNSDEFSKILTTGAITANGTIEASYTDSSGIVVTLTANQADTKIYYQIIPDGGSSNTEGYVTTDSNGKYRLTGVPSASHVYIAAKKDGYDYYKTDFDPAVTTDIVIPLGAIDSIDSGISISSYSLTSGTNNNNRIYFDYSDSGKSHIIFGEIDLDPASNARNLSRRVFDAILSTEEGLKFLANWNRSGSITDLDGKPYKIISGKISINTAYLDITRIPGMTANEKSYFGEYVADEDDERYRAPQSNNDNVSIASPSDVIEATPAIFREFAEYVTADIDNNSTKLEAVNSKVSEIKTGVSDVEELLQSNDEHFLAVDGISERVFGFDKNFNRSDSFDYLAHTSTNDIRGIKTYKNKEYIMDLINSTTLRFYRYDVKGKFETSFDIAITSSHSPEDFDIIEDSGGVEIIYVLMEGSTNKLLAFKLSDRNSISDDDITLSGIETPTAIHIRRGFAYISDERGVSTSTQIKPVKLSDGSITTSDIITASDVSQPIAIIALIDYVIIVDGDDNDVHFYNYDGTKNKVVSLSDTLTDIEGLAHFKSLPFDLQEIHDSIDEIKDVTDHIPFSADGDVLATLEGELVTTDDDSRTASKADVSGIGAPDLSTLATQTTVDAIKVQSDKFGFDENNNVKSVEQIPSNILAERILVANGSDGKAYALDENNNRIPKLDFELHDDHQHSRGFTHFEGYLYALDATSTNEVTIFIYTPSGAFVTKRAMAISNQNVQDISVSRDPDGQVIVRILQNATVNKLIAFRLETLQEVTAKTMTVDVENPLGYYLSGRNAYVTDARNSTNDIPRIRVFNVDDHSLDSPASFSLPTTFRSATSIIVQEHHIAIINRPTRLLGIFKHNGSSISTKTLPTEISDAYGMVWISSIIHDVKKITEDTQDIDEKISTVEDRIVNNTEYDPDTSILSFKNKDATGNLAQYDIKDEDDNPTGNGSHAYKVTKRAT